MNPILRNFIIEAIVVILQGITFAIGIVPGEIAFPVIVLVGIAAIVNVVILLKGSLSGDGMVRRTDELDRNDEPVYGSRIDLTDGRTVEIKWNDSTPNGVKINGLPEGTRVRVSYWKRPIGGAIIDDVKVLG